MLTQIGTTSAGSVAGEGAQWRFCSAHAQHNYRSRFKRHAHLAIGHTPQDIVSCVSRGHLRENAV